MHVEEINKGELRVTYETEEGMISLSVSEEGVILDFYDGMELGDPTSLGFTVEELADFIKTKGVR